MAKVDTAQGERYEVESGAPRQQNYVREDLRWEQASTARDWVILLVIMALHTAWMLLVFFLEPGIR